MRPGGGSSIFAANRTCLQQHEGTGSDLALTMQDPSKENFCAYLTGSRSFSAAPPERVCQLFDLVSPTRQCRASFCLLGTQGYFDFVLSLVASLRQYATWIGVGFSVLVLFQVVLIVNLYNLQRAIAPRRREGGDGWRSRTVPQRPSLVQKV